MSVKPIPEVLNRGASALHEPDTIYTCDHCGKQEEWMLKHMKPVGWVIYRGSHFCCWACYAESFYEENAGGLTNGS